MSQRPLYPGDGGVHSDRRSPGHPPAASQRHAPDIPDNDPPREGTVTRHQQGFTVIHPTPAFPSPVTPDGTGSSGFPLGFAPHRAGPGNARQGGDRPGHCLDYVPDISQPPSTYSLTTCDLTSHDRPEMRPSAHERRRPPPAHGGGYFASDPRSRRSRRTMRVNVSRVPWIARAQAGGPGPHGMIMAGSRRPACCRCRCLGGRSRLRRGLARRTGRAPGTRRSPAAWRSRRLDGQHRPVIPRDMSDGEWAISEPTQPGPAW